MKKTIYIFSFTVLGVLVSFLLHGILELIIIELLLTDFTRYNLGLSWPQWFLIHRWGSLLLLTAGVGVGFWQGVRWWSVLYEGGEGSRY